jgi:kynureninase
MVELLDEAGMDSVRKKSEALTSYAIHLSDEHLAPYGVEVASPRDAAQRGGHVTVGHPRMREVVESLWRDDVLPDYRDPGGLRIGLSPLSTSYDELERGMRAVAQVFDGR